MFGDAVIHHGIEVCFRCKCRAKTYELGHSRPHAHFEERKICLAMIPKTFTSFFTAMHEIGHIVHPKASYGKGYPRSLAEWNATQWAVEKCRALKVPIRRKVIASYRAYVKNKIERGLRRGLQNVPRELRKLKATPSTEVAR